MNIQNTAAALAVAFLSFSPIAHAVILQPGDRISNGGDFDPYDGGIRFADLPQYFLPPVSVISEQVNFVNGGTVFPDPTFIPDLHEMNMGFTQEVMAGPDGINFRYDFTNQVLNSFDPTGATRWILDGFAGREVDVQYLDIAPINVSRSSDGDVIIIEPTSFGFLIDFPFTMFIGTDAPGYASDGTLTMNAALGFAGRSETFTVAAPSSATIAPVPVPASLPLFLAGLAALWRLRAKT